MLWIRCKDQVQNSETSAHTGLITTRHMISCFAATWLDLQHQLLAYGSEAPGRLVTQQIFTQCRLEVPFWPTARSVGGIVGSGQPLPSWPVEFHCSENARNRFNGY